MRRTLGFVLACALLLGACGQKTEATWQERYDLGVKYLSEGNYEEAIIAFTSAIEIDPKRPEALMGRGDAYVGQAEAIDPTSEETAGAYENALTDFLAAINLDQLLVEAYKKAAMIYSALGNLDAAREILDRGYEATQQELLLAYKDSLLPSSEYESQNENDPVRLERSPAGDIEGEYFSVHVLDSRTAEITLSGLSLKDAYLTNHSESRENYADYQWRVNMYGPQYSYGVSTVYYARMPGRNIMMSLEDMQDTLWVKGDTSWPAIGDVEMSYTNSGITWTVRIPDEYPMDFSAIEQYEVRILDPSENIDYKRIYQVI